jgi:hypothetical protein
MDVYSTELGILLIFGKTSEVRGGGGLKPPFGTPLYSSVSNTVFRECTNFR